MSAGSQKHNRTWQEVNPWRFESNDGAVVKYDKTVMCSTSKPWLKNHRGWIAFAPGKDEFNYLGFYRKNSQLRIPRKFKTSTAAIKAVDRECV